VKVNVVQTSVYLYPDEREKAKALAGLDDRSVSRLIGQLISALPDPTTKSTKEIRNAKF
jgi:hypothetical protein